MNNQEGPIGPSWCSRGSVAILMNGWPIAWRDWDSYLLLTSLLVSASVPSPSTGTHAVHRSGTDMYIDGYPLQPVTALQGLNPWRAVLFFGAPERSNHLAKEEPS